MCLQRRDLKKAINEFSKKTNFYELGLIRKLLIHREKEKEKLRKMIPHVKCPFCGSSKIIIDYDDSEYSSYEFLTCENCLESFDDIYDYINNKENYDNIRWGYPLDIVLYFENPNIKLYEWQELCRSLILKELNIN